MQESKLNFQQKLFAVIEGLVKQTKIKSINLNFPASVKPLTYDVESRTRTLDFSIDSRITGLLDEFTQVEVKDACVSAISSTIVDEKVETINCAGVFEADICLPIETKDLFEKFEVNKKFKFALNVKGINLTDLKPRPHSLNITISPTLKDNLPFFKRFPVEKKPIVLSYLSEEEQLQYWKNAVLKTRKDPKKLKLVGVYKGIPRGSIENIKINYSTNYLNYNFKTFFSPNKKSEPFKDIALFQDIEIDKSVMVSK